MVFQHCTAAYLLCTVCTPCLLTGRCMQSDVPVYSTVRWSDLALFSIFENGHIPDCQVHFNEVNSKNIKNEYLFRKFANIILLL